MRGIAAFTAGLLVVLLLGVGGPTPALGKNSSPARVTMGYIGAALSNAPVFIAIEKGYFQEQNIQLELQTFASGTDQVPLLANETLHIGSGALGPGFFNAIAQGIPIWLVADKGSLPPGFGFNVFVVRQDLIDSGAIQSTADLKGKTFGVEAMTASTMVYYDAILKSGGLTFDDVRFTSVALPDMPAALANKAVDAVVTVEPFGTVMESQGTGKIFLTLDELLPNFQISSVFYSHGFAEKQRDVAVGWMVAYLKGVQFYHEAFADAAKKEELIEILAKYSGITDRELYDKMIYPGLDPRGMVNVDSVAHQQEFWRERGLIPNPVPIEQVVNQSFVEEALAILGR